MHNSFNPEIKFHMDVKRKTGNNYRFAGWVFHQAFPIEEIIFREGSSSYSSNDFLERKDVQGVYPNLANSFVGFDFEFDASEESPQEEFELSVKINKEFLIIARVKKPKDTLAIGKVNNIHPSIIAVDDFYKNPDEVRDYALGLDFQYNKEQHKGKRTRERTFFEGTYEFLQDALKKKITSWDNQPHNGVFQFCTAQDHLVYHTDGQQYAAVVFLTPNAPASCGTSFFKHKGNGLRKYPTDEDCAKFNKSRDEIYWDMFEGNFYDKTPWELVDVVGNVYNRMVIWDAKLVHAATQYFGSDKMNSRLFHMFFFDAE
tara:strand:+ start:599 stop:1543 length:945 start_codon:yes stop_codon:yes gene_type:complete